MKKSVLTIIALLAVCPALYAQGNPRIDRIDPFRLKTQQSGWATITVQGDFPLATESHPDRSEYEHWFIHRGDDPGAWECKPAGEQCQLGNWSRTSQELRISSEFLKSPGTLELRMNEGFSGIGVYTDTVFASVPLLDTFGAPPVVIAVTPSTFTSGAAANQFTMRVAANNFDNTAVVVFRGDTVVKPSRVIDGTTLEVTVPEKYRSADGELTLQVRTDRGGFSKDAYFKVAKPRLQGIAAAGMSPTASPASRAVISSGMAAAVSPDVMLTRRIREAVAQRIGSEQANRLQMTAKSGAVTVRGWDPAKKAEVQSIIVNVTGVKSVVMAE